MRLNTLSEHIEYSENEINVKYTNFVKCKAIDGGAIASNFNGQHNIAACSFTKCIAQGKPESRGGAIFITNGNSSLLLICAYQCSGTTCSDIIIFRNANECFVDMLQSTKSSGIHSMYYAGNIISLKNVNSSFQTTTNEANFGEAITFKAKGVCKSNNVKFCNCTGNSAIMGYDECSNADFEMIDYVFANNDAPSGLHVFRQVSNSNIELVNSIFWNNIINHEYTTASNGCTFEINYENCRFDVSETMITSNHQNCEFGITNDDVISELSFNYECFLNVPMNTCATKRTISYYLFTIYILNLPK